MGAENESDGNVSAFTSEQSERAAIVAWLRNGNPPAISSFREVADAIERGDHLRPKPPERQVVGTETCPLSVGHPYGKGATLGYHVVGADRCCCFCGSWHPDEFEAWCRKVLDGSERAAWTYDNPALSGLAGEALSLNDRRDKLYVRRAGISNGSEGAIKVKVAHLSREQVDLANETLRRCREQAVNLTKAPAEKESE